MEKNINRWKCLDFFFLQWSAENGAISDTDKKHLNTTVNIAALNDNVHDTI
jgi:hypothetical protein